MGYRLTLSVPTVHRDTREQGPVVSLVVDITPRDPDTQRTIDLSVLVAGLRAVR